MDGSKDAQRVVNSLLAQISVLSQEKAMLLAQIDILNAQREEVVEDGDDAVPAD